MLKVIYAPDTRFESYRITSTPTLVALGTTGVLDKKAGYQSPEELLEWLQGIK